MPARGRGLGGAAAPPPADQADVAALQAAIQADQQQGANPAAVHALIAGNAAPNAQGGADALNQQLAALAQPKPRTKRDSLTRHDGTSRGHRTWVDSLESTLYQNGVEAQAFLTRAHIADGSHDPQVNAPGYDSAIRRHAMAWGHIHATLDPDALDKVRHVPPAEATPL